MDLKILFHDYDDHHHHVPFSLILLIFLLDLLYMKTLPSKPGQQPHTFYFCFFILVCFCFLVCRQKSNSLAIFTCFVHKKVVTCQKLEVQKNWVVCMFFFLHTDSWSIFYCYFYYAFVVWWLVVSVSTYLTLVNFFIIMFVYLFVPLLTLIVYQFSFSSIYGV